MPHLIRYLHKKHNLTYVIGHHEYYAFQGSDVWKETDPDYLTQKQDPGDKFMKKLRKELIDLNFKYKPLISYENKFFMECFFKMPDYLWLSYDLFYNPVKPVKLPSS
jgi:hypothetical protein